MHGLFSSLTPLLRTLRRERFARRFFFMRKAPGLRLRFALGRAHATAEARVVEVLDALVRSGVLGKWSRGTYEPETYKFGGPEAIHLAHAHFHADSAAWWRWTRLHRADATVIGTQVLSIAVLNDLFVRALEGPEEVWDVWCQVAALHGRRPPMGAATAPRLRIEDLVARVSVAERGVLEAYSRANRRLARRLRSMHEAGALVGGARGALSQVALYHWNRFGFGDEARVNMFGGMTNAWSSTVDIGALSSKG